jgi:PHD/YefM family antitoxin component YafN of YafNO toxin-antitoxin module
MAAMTAREFNQYTGRAKRMADAEPVYITERDEVKYVLMSINEFNSARTQKLTLSELLAMGEDEYFAFAFDNSSEMFRSAELA